MSFEHHRLVAALDHDAAHRLLDDAAADGWSAQQLRTKIKQRRRNDRETTLRTEIRRVIYADPPRQFEPFSRETGLNRAADNHYPTMTVSLLKGLAVPAADDCVLFLRATAPMLREADVMDAWGIKYRSHCIRAKDRIATGYWFRNKHELLLGDVKGEIPAPAPGERFDSLIEAPVGRHSQKPMIETLHPHLPRLEMFARQHRAGCEVWGNEADREAAE